MIWARTAVHNIPSVGKVGTKSLIIHKKLVTAKLIPGMFYIASFCFYDIIYYTIKGIDKCST